MIFSNKKISKTQVVDQKIQKQQNQQTSFIRIKVTSFISKFYQNWDSLFQA